MKTIANVLNVSYLNLTERLKGSAKPRCPFLKAADIELLPAIRRLIDGRLTGMLKTEDVHILPGGTTQSSKSISVSWSCFHEVLMHIIFVTILCLVSCLLISRMASAQVRTITLTSENLDVSGTNDVAAVLQSKIGDGSVKINLPCGTLLVASAIELPSGTQIEGSGTCTVMKMSSHAKATELQAKYMSGASGVQRSVFTNRAPRDANIVVRKLAVDGRASPASGQMISFFGVSHVLIEDVYLMGAGTPATQDGISFVASSDYVVRHNFCVNFTNACYDNWGGDSNFQITSNYIDGSRVLTYGILVNGITTDYKSATSANFIIKGDTIYNVKELGIGAYGLCSTDRTVCGSVVWVTIEGNYIYGVSKLHGIMVGNGSKIRIAHNVINGAAGDGVRIAAQNIGGRTEDVVVVDNVINAHPEAGAAIAVGSGNDLISNIQVLRNHLTGYSRPLSIARGALVQSDMN